MTAQAIQDSSKPHNPGMQDPWAQNSWNLPAFASITDDDYLHQARSAMDGQLQALDQLAADQSITGTALLEAWEASAIRLTRITAAFFTLHSADATSRRNQIAEELAPHLAAHHDSVYLNTALYERFVELDHQHASGHLALDPQDSWLLHETLRSFRRSGVALASAQMAQLRSINSRIASLEAHYDTLVVQGRADAAVHITDVSALDGLDSSQLAAASAAAHSRGLDGYLLELINTTAQPLLAQLTQRSTRQALYVASASRGQQAGSDVRPLILEIIALRADKARLLGYPHYAAYVADGGCAQNTTAVMDMLTTVANAARRNVEQEAVGITAALQADIPGATLEPWDWAYYAARVGAGPEVDGDASGGDAAGGDVASGGVAGGLGDGVGGVDGVGVAGKAFDPSALTPYLSFERVLTQGVFAAATALYGITFVRREDISGYTSQCITYEVREASGDPIGLVIIDPYARPTKQGGAWMTSLVDQSHMTASLPVVTNNCNQTSAEPGQPSLMTWDQVITLFHEFGHDLHGLLSDVRYPSRSGTDVPRDFVEFPSQVAEIWAWEPWLIDQYARHHASGQPLPGGLKSQLLASAQVPQGFDAAEVYQAMLLDQAWHQATPEDLPASVDHIDAWEQTALERMGVYFAPVPPRYRSCYFSHIWGPGYAAAYYGYLWADVIAADATAWFAQQGALQAGQFGQDGTAADAGTGTGTGTGSGEADDGGASDGGTDRPAHAAAMRQAGEHFRRTLLASGGSIDVMEAYQNFAGRKPDPQHLITRKGLG